MKVQETPAHPDHQATFAQGTHALCPFGYVPLWWNVGIERLWSVAASCNGRSMIRRICGTKDQDETPLVSLL